MPGPRQSLRTSPPPRDRAAATAPAAPAPVWRDPWALAVAAGVLPLLAAARHAPAGEPFADDFLFLDFSVLRHNPSWWDGGGGAAYWRPLARQAYYGAFGPLMLAHPGVVAALHALVLAASGVLLYRALRRAWPAPAAAVAGAFPLGLEAARTLFAWPSGAQDLGALFFLALALHAHARGRGVVAAMASVAAALCKEVAAPLALLAAFAPFPRGASRRARVTTGAALAAWAVLRFAVPHPGLASLANPLAGSIPAATRLLWTFPLAARDVFGLVGVSPWAIGAVLACAVVPLAAAVPRAGRTRRTWAWCGWGLAWFGAGAAPLALFLPDWAPFRSVLPAAGLGIALVAPLAGAARAWLLPLVGARLVTLLAAPQPPARLALDIGSVASAMDFPRLALLQRTARDVRAALRAAAPVLPPGARVIREGMPRMTGVAFEGDLALQCWYGDRSLRWVTAAALGDQAVARVDAMVEFEPDRTPQFASVAPGSMLETLAGVAESREGRPARALAAFARAESLQPDTTAARYLANVAGLRAGALVQLDRLAEAEAQAGLAMGRYPDTPNGRYVLAQVRALRGDLPGAESLLVEHVAAYPDDPAFREMLRLVRHQLGRSP